MISMTYTATARRFHWLAFAPVCALLWAFSAHAEPPTQYSQDQLFKNWALSNCLAKAEHSKDAAAAAGGYLEFGDYPIAAYDEGAKLVADALAQEYTGTQDVRYDTMKCIDLFYGKALDTLSKKHLKHAKK